MGATKFLNGEAVGNYNRLIRPTRPLPDRISALTGLTSGELDWAHSFSDVMPGFLQFIENLPIVAHNADFDMGFLREKLPRIENEIPTNLIWDNLKLGVLLYPEIQSYGLEALADTFGVPVVKSHRASEDCIVTGKLFLQFLKNAPAIFKRKLLEKIANEYLIDTDLSVSLQHILNHPDYDKYAAIKKTIEIPIYPKAESTDRFKNIATDSEDDMLIRITPEEDESPHDVFCNDDLYPDTKRHYYVFPSTQYPGNYWGIDKKWNELFDKTDGIELYPGKSRLLCRLQMRIFIEENIHDRLSLTGFEIAVLNAFSSISESGNFSRLSWWIWNNMPNLASAIPYLNASTCNHENCPFTDDCFYLKAVEKAKSTNRLGFPFRVLKEEMDVPRNGDSIMDADLTIMNPEGIFRDNLSAGIKAFGLSHNNILMKKIIKFLGNEDSSQLLKILARANTSIDLLNSLVDGIIQNAGNRRLQKGKRFFLFIDDSLKDESAGVIHELGNLVQITHDFVNSLSTMKSDPVIIIARMLKNQCIELANAIEQMKKDNMVLCFDKIEKGTPDECRFLFFPHIFHDEFLEFPDNIKRIIYLTHHIEDTEDWEKYILLLGRDKIPVKFHDLSNPIPEGNKIFLAPPKSVEVKPSKKKLMEIKGEAIADILSKFRGRTIVIVRGSQELLNFKYRLSLKLKKAGFWPLFQKQDGPKGLLIKEFSKHKNVVFFGLTDLVSNILQFKNPPENLIFESLHLTSMQDPIEVFIKNEIEDTGADYLSEYLEPRIHFTLTRSIKRWKNYLDGKARIFILDEKLATSESGLIFLSQLEGEQTNM